MPLEVDGALIAELQRRLRVSRSAVPKAELVAVALRLAQDPTLDPSVGNFWKDAGVASSDSRKRIKLFALRMMDEGHLAAAQQALAHPGAAQPWQSLFGLSDNLLLEPRWIDQHVPNIMLTMVEPLVLRCLSCGAFAQRFVRARCSVTSVELCCEVTYNLPPVEGESNEAEGRRRGMHRKREETALRSLDNEAAAAFRSKHAKQQQYYRERDAEICDVLDKLVGTIERAFEREANAWRCPDGCAPGSDCARAAFRKTCVPARRVNSIWAKEHTYAGWSGHEFRFEKQHQLRQLEPDYHQAFHVTDEMREDFLAMWDGIVEPYFFWEPWHSERTGEYCGLSAPGAPRGADEFGWDHRQVGQEACARRGCHGCCYCRGKPLCL